MLKNLMLSFLLVLVPFISFNYVSANDSMDANTKKIIQSYINFDEKLKTCTPAELARDGSIQKIHGIKNGICYYTEKSSLSFSNVKNTKTGEIINKDLGNCEYRFPISIAKRFANNRIKLTKSVYQIDGVRLNNSEIEKISVDQMNIAKQYCK